MSGMTSDIDRPCLHLHFDAHVEVARIVDNTPPETSIPVGYSASVWVWCKNCGERFRWVGVEVGISPRNPMCNPDGYELRAPLQPASAAPDLGMSLPGFSVRIRQEPSETDRSDG